MADIYASIQLSDKDISKDTLYISADKNTISLILSLVDNDLLVEPKITSKSGYLKMLKNPPKSIELKLGNEKISKETLIGALQFVGLLK